MDFKADDLRRIRTLHSSPSSDVYIAEHVDGSRQLVVKRTKITGPNDMKRFDKELELLQACDHECVVRPHGVLRVPPTYALVLPVYTRGSLFGLLHATGKTLTLHAKLSVACDLANAVAHLHERGVLHRDIKSDNALIADSGRAVLGDFNAAEWEAQVTADIVMQSRPTGGFFKQFVVGTLPYMAPELLRSVRGAAYARACDVYSLAITVNEVLTQTVPYSDAMTEQVQLHTILEARYNHEALTVAIASDGLRPAITDVASLVSPEEQLAATDVTRLVMIAWADDAPTRPSMGDLLPRLQAIKQSIFGSAALDADAFFEASAAPMDEVAAVVDGANTAASSVAAAVHEAAGTSTRAVGAAATGASNQSGFGSWSTSDAKILEELARGLGQDSGHGRLLRVGWEATAGRRGADRMEDRVVACAVPGVALAAVFDGHNGDAAAEYCRLHVAEVITAKIRAAGTIGAGGSSESMVDVAATSLQAAFVALNESFAASATADDSGCTALAALCLPAPSSNGATSGHVLVANAGDCVCVLWRGDTLVPLNAEHTAALASERQRVEAAGATVSQTSDGKLRVGGVIQVTRCIGDRPLRHLGLTSEPELTRVELQPDDKMIVMASDGLWDVMSYERVLHCLKHTAKSPDLIAKRLLGEALDRGTTDNTSVAVCFLQDLE